MSALEDLHIAGLSALYRAGALSPKELVDRLYDRIEADALEGEWIYLLPRADALVAAAALEARPDAQALPLYGIPFGVKDNIDVAAMPTTAACPAFAYTPDRHATTVRALLDAGALCLGKLNLDQFATGLVGSRSPYGVARNVFDPAYLAGGSSSGSALAVAAHHVSFALGTDTAGSGRVPPALNNLVGLKPTVGRWSTEGVVPACASLDCVGVFALNVSDAVCVRAVIEGAPTVVCPPAPPSFRFGVPEPLAFGADPHSALSFERSLRALEALGGVAVSVDFAPFDELGDLLYGPFVWERYLAVGAFIVEHPDSVLPVTRDIIVGATAHSAADVMRAAQRARVLVKCCAEALSEVDFLVVPSVPAPLRVDDDLADPRHANDRLGTYTRFANFIGCPAVTVPQDFRPDGLPSSVSLLTLPDQDERLLAVADALHVASNAGMGRMRTPVATRVVTSPAVRRAKVAVVGAHMSGMPLNVQLTELGAQYLATTRTAGAYRLFALAGTAPERPGLVRVARGGASIEVEVWELSWEGLGTLLSKVPPPLCIGSLELEAGEWVRGFLCESSATEHATDISHFGGYRAYVASRSFRT